MRLKVTMIVPHADNWMEAERLFWLSYACQEAHFGASHPEVIGVLRKLSRFYRDWGKFAEAEVLCWHLWETEGDVPSLDLWRCLKLLSALYSFIGKYNDAIRLLSRVEEVRTWKKQAVVVDPAVAMVKDFYEIDSFGKSLVGLAC